MRGIRIKCVAALMLTYTLLSNGLLAQQASEAQPKQANASTDSSAHATAPIGDSSRLTDRERSLIDRIDKLERRLADLESRATNSAPLDNTKPAAVKEVLNKEVLNKEVLSKEVLSKEVSSDTTLSSSHSSAVQNQTSKDDRTILDFLRDTTLNLTVDGYYGYNFNRPVGRINLLRAYDVMSNSFSLNQAAVVIERAPNVEAGRRFGMRLDLQYGQATETVQGSASNELRPQTYRNIWQAFGTYVVPVGEGLTVDFGKFASSLGYESNYTKDNLNYSRSYYFNFLPFYHFGFRARYPVNDKLTVTYHLMNGIQQSEDFNGFKSQHLALILTPVKKVSWQINYYTGIEGRDEAPDLNPGLPTLPTQPGLPTGVIRPAQHGRTHIMDTYATINATDKLTLVIEGDYVINRLNRLSPPSRVTGVVMYARYQLAPAFALAGRAEYLSDRGGLFSGLTQALKETTLTADFKLADGFLLRGEWRRDFSNQRFFLTEIPGFLKKEQNTATVGLVWWMGRKLGSW